MAVQLLLAQLIVVREHPSSVQLRHKPAPKPKLTPLRYGTAKPGWAEPRWISKRQRMGRTEQRSGLSDAGSSVAGLGEEAARLCSKGCWPRVLRPSPGPVPGRGWHSSVLSSRRLRNHPASLQPQEQKPCSLETHLLGADLFALG